MDEQQAHHCLTELDSNLSPEEEYNARYPDYTMEMSQSGERFRSRENMRAFQEARAEHTPPRRGLSSSRSQAGRRSTEQSRGIRSSSGRGPPLGGSRSSIHPSA